jgi:hypothetical protein
MLRPQDTVERHSPPSRLSTAGSPLSDKKGIPRDLLSDIVQFAN